ncbi:elongation factor P [Candidatus Roizmanbacteria bacterium RIFCSPHIGHO2_02_FULL_37_15]|uniref:Elongation factor P n=1 Tax=Candidatus Roizmanbacteria bacterium RIFCSPLOWO2_01_FULL_37_16 TaxID=1802058 RepID=A0A1F7IJQ6_9BACT|nr:MAG: elongation factor P [Candidatus Roizmanbacteria bacterium RIFCSPHIGHO2_01_FULL_37_16b]OGK22103.1 MAG: elongation factor P [Candidatus Roizmanbacteria bacterium RIFCSPHIGHO2_02_FULL_37_15]OGK31529.1 MAG: elongation factor P [Candidatus Roizmanbacteria bacterium RIFCSPHIGHO2_12_FULL_36_11]OGK43598.1 MAG: elongation factor P [Candidatus Roizmanbacteria bacterium RIFCSPLOWO2_01_FULL_37_16]
MNINAGNLKKGDFIKYQNEIWQVQKAEFYSPGKGSALMKTRIKNLLSGKNIEFTFKSNETVETVDIDSIEMQFLYKDAQNLHFMNERTYQQYTLPLKVASEAANFLQEGKKYFVYLHNDNPLSLRPPASVRLKVIETEQAVKGDTVTGARKPAKLETGVIIQVPLFIKNGDTVAVNPETGEYVERVKI